MRSHAHTQCADQVQIPRPSDSSFDSLFLDQPRATQAPDQPSNSVDGSDEPIAMLVQSQAEGESESRHARYVACQGSYGVVELRQVEAKVPR